MKVNSIEAFKTIGSDGNFTITIQVTLENNNTNASLITKNPDLIEKFAAKIKKKFTDEIFENSAEIDILISPLRLNAKPIPKEFLLCTSIALHMALASSKNVEFMTYIKKISNTKTQTSLTLYEVIKQKDFSLYLIQTKPTPLSSALVYAIINSHLKTRAKVELKLIDSIELLEGAIEQAKLTSEFAIGFFSKKEFGNKSFTIQETNENIIMGHSNKIYKFKKPTVISNFATLTDLINIDKDVILQSNTKNETSFEIDIALGLGIKGICLGIPRHAENTAKYNRLIELLK